VIYEEAALGPLDGQHVRIDRIRGVAKRRPAQLHLRQSVGIAKKCRRHLLARHALRGRHLQRPGVDVLWLAKQEANDVEVVRTKFEHDQRSHPAQKWLPDEEALRRTLGRGHGCRRPGGEAQVERLADHSAIEQVSRCAIPWAPPPVLVDHQTDARRLAVAHHCYRLGEARRQWLLAEDVFA
jgi:hypothetical protein